MMCVSSIMKLIKLVAVLVALIGVCALLVVGAPALYGQARADRFPPDLLALLGPGAEIGVSVREADTKENEGVVIEEIRPGSPAEKAGLKTADVVVEFDGERVRSARQFSRLVQETPPGRTVKASVLRDGRRADVQITPAARGRANLRIDGDRIRARLGDLADRIPSLLDGESSRGRLGVTVQEMPKQLADYFGASSGVLVSAVADNSPAARAGLKAGDVITSVNGVSVRWRGDLMRQLVDGTDSREVTIGIVRDKKESTLKATIEARRKS